jgi:hypothetical protein
MRQLFLANNRYIISLNKLHIISNCVISNNTVVKNNEKVFASGANNFQSFLLSVYQHLKIDYPKFYKMDNLSKLGFLASEVLSQDEKDAIIHPEKTGLVLCNANASLDADLKYFESTKEIPSPALFVYTLPNIIMGEICIRNKFKGENAFFVSEEFNAGFMHQYVGDLFANNILELCICGWVDVLKENYKVVLFLVSTKSSEEAVLFTEQNINRIFKSIA